MKYLFVFLLLGIYSCGNDATKEVKVDSGKKKIKTAKQLNCDEIEGAELCNREDILDATIFYTGIVKCCKNGKIRSFATFKKGKQNGLSRTWYDNGQLFREVNYKDGKADGLRRGWYDNGQLEHETNFKDNKENGLHRTWHDNGQLKYEGNHKEGEQNGLIRTWYDNGQLKVEANYKDGKLISSKLWDEDGKGFF